MPVWMMKLLAFLIERLFLRKVSDWVREEMQKRSEWKEIQEQVKELQKAKTNDEIIKHLRNINI